NNSNFLKNTIANATKKYILLIFLNQLIFCVLICIFKILNLKILFILNLIKFIAYYILYKEAICLVLDESFNEVKAKIINSEKRFKKSNNLLKKKTSTLIELSNLIEQGYDNYEKIIQSIEDSMFIFKEEQLDYINDRAINLLGVKNSN
ncbi:hypothetical protein, partial [Clostridium tarantellae]|uniref:hypothetical protein n=1 Tax=Clostridium tarantellae TaxID=39493 RepID=UPI001478D8C7